MVEGYFTIFRVFTVNKQQHVTCPYLQVVLIVISNLYTDAQMRCPNDTTVTTCCNIQY